MPTVASKIMTAMINTEDRRWLEAALARARKELSENPMVVADRILREIEEVLARQKKGGNVGP